MVYENRAAQNSPDGRDSDWSHDQGAWNFGFCFRRIPDPAEADTTITFLACSPIERRGKEIQGVLDLAFRHDQRRDPANHIIIRSASQQE